MSAFDSIKHAVKGVESNNLFKDLGDTLLKDLSQSFQQDPSSVLDVLNQMKGSKEAVPAAFPQAKDLFGTGDSNAQPAMLNQLDQIASQANGGAHTGLTEILQTVGKLVSTVEKGLGGGGNILNGLLGGGEGNLLNGLISGSGEAGGLGSLLSGGEADMLGGLLAGGEGGGLAGLAGVVEEVAPLALVAL